MRLKPEDALAVDLLLDGNGRLEVSGEAKVRRDAAHKVLRMLDALPTIDPSTNLIDMTLSRVQDAAGRVAAMGDSASEGTFVPPTGLRAS
ncbi:MAG TPA: hypothetical protein VFE58_00530 [Tepidisphaeraceae bacterium]|nr:hypothetical protein [Tepidisphaeraceae bacterium]